MTARTAHKIRTGLAGLLLIAASLLVAIGLTVASRAGIAGPAPVDAAVDPSMSAVIPPLAPAAGTVQDAPPGGSGGSVAAPAPAAPVVTDPTADDVGQLWRRGEYLGAGLLALFLLLSFALKVDPKRAFVYTGILGGLAGVVDLIALGQTPNLGMLIGAAVAAIALITRSPLPPAPRQPERGSATRSLLALLAGAALTVGAAMAAWSCGDSAPLGSPPPPGDACPVIADAPPRPPPSSAPTYDCTALPCVEICAGVTCGGPRVICTVNSLPVCRCLPVEAPPGCS